MTKKREIKTNNNRHQYGLLSMLAMIVGVVVGSGVYVVNDSLYELSGSVGLIIITWIIISAVVLFMLVAFIEVASITARTKEPGTVNNWFRHFFGKKGSKYIGVFFPIIYFPILISVLAVIGSEQLFNTIWIDGDNSKPYLMFLFVTIFAYLFASLFYGVNAFTQKPGKIFQNTGTIIKLIPLFLLIFLGILVAANAFSPANEAFDNGGNFNFFDPNAAFNQGWENGADGWDSGVSNLEIILLMAPTIMFSFDGFLFAASLQNESKKPSTYKIAAITGIVFIVFIYIVLSLFVFAFGTSGENHDFSVVNCVFNITGQKWLSIIIGLMIVISVYTGFSACTIAQNRMIADLSVNNQIRDKNGDLIARNKAKVPQRAALWSWGLTIFWLTILRILDLAILISIISEDSSVITSTLFISGWSLNFITLLSYSVYTLLIIGAFKNRFDKKVEVEKTKGFYPAAIISIFAMFIVLIVFTINLFDYRSIFDQNDNLVVSGLLSYLIHILMVIFIIFLAIFIPNYFEKDVKKVQKEELEKKEKLIKQYLKNKTDPRFS
ncbi:L-type amino acid transporter [Candidatus Hepatoplasma crinochetorum Av]|uniref:L-type amino acid transporter n=1 Tax=Candidatus Hepatoplasma crinochetorum Av TaxID=1427984 RepID=W8GF73_9MOLU|nr:amino acid permease [Candidatus Hepatoplasma crinochetorum]AHK22258.1 L-type amino acid transporter [Candidatus Hepatoplasma crinochetorum Av]